MAEAAREHVERIRKTKFSIGGEANPLTEDLHQAVKNLSAELYAKDVHFLMELIQNAEDNEYPNDVDPSLEFVITSRDITATGAPATLLIFNNEKGFSSKNIESICSVGRSTKKGNRKRGYIGEKGIGFKSVFLITSQPFIFSNGYQIQFNEAPCPHCSLGYIVPEWVEEQPSLADIEQIYGSGSTLPTTTIILPLKADKVKAVKEQLSSVHPEVLLFLSKIKRLSVREHNEDPRLNTVNSIGITSETNFRTRKNIDAESYTILLSAHANGDNSERECSYYMWKQKFPVRPENRVERRLEAEYWVITLAFPYGERLNRGLSSPGVYAFLPTEMVTNFPFIIQADFILASSRETILLDDIWNQGILTCVASAFVCAFTSLVKTADTPVSSLLPMFKFLPVNSSSYPKLNTVRDSIKGKLTEQDIVPSGPYSGQKFFHKPSEVGRLIPAFWDIMEKARRQGVNLHTVSSHGIYILDSSFDKPENDAILNFLGVQSVSNEWYTKCIRGSNLVSSVSEDLYLELLHFLADNWGSKFHCTDMVNMPLIKYVAHNGNSSLGSVAQFRSWVLCVPPSQHLSWLLDWNKEFRCLVNHCFMPLDMMRALRSSSKKEQILNWLREQVREVVNMKVSNYADAVLKCLNSNGMLAIPFAHFLYHSFSRSLLSESEVDRLCSAMPLMDNYGNLSTRRNGVLVPATGSKWVGLIGSNPWRQAGYIELGEDYLQPRCLAGGRSNYGELIAFLKSHVGAADIPCISPPDAGVPALAGPLKKDNAFLLLDWIRYLKSRGIHLPERFLTSVREGSWLRIELNGCSDYKPPSQSFFYTTSWGSILQNGSILVDIPLVDQSFYGSKITKYKEELKTAGVMFEFGEACKFIGKHLMSLAASFTLSKSNVLSMLSFIRYLREKLLPPDEFIRSVREGRWLRTSCGDRSPVGAVLFDEDWKRASQISDIPFLDKDYYGDEILSFEMELQLLGVEVGFNGNYSLVVAHLKSSSELSYMTADAVLMILECMSHLSPPKLVNALSNVKCFRTHLGYQSPRDCFLLDPEWGCLLKVFNCFPLISDEFYGSKIFLYKDELKQLGVVVEFEEAVKAFARIFKQRASSSSITKENAMALLSCYRKLKGTPYKFPKDLKSCIREYKWLRTRLCDHRSPKECILFCPEWISIQQITLLPFIDDGDKCYGRAIHEYKKELKSMGVIVELKDGVKYIPSCLKFPSDPSFIAPASALSLLKCIGLLLEDRCYSFPKEFLEKVSVKWLKTRVGYQSPDQCLLFDAKWELEPTDGPFIDEWFYGPEIQSRRKELNAIGVIPDGIKGCELLANHLGFLSDFDAIVRVYKFLNKFAWKPTNGAASRIWIPDGKGNGKWVDSQQCVLHDKDNLFGSELHVLEKHYEPELLIFFSSAFEVSLNPSLDDYCKVWKVWETTRQRLSHDECCAFWRYVMRHMRSEQTLAECLVSLPVGPDPDGILLSNKNDAFIADDLLLKDLFVNSSARPIFVWFPQPSSPSLPRAKLLEVYKKIGVRTISKCVQREELSLADGVEFKQVEQGNSLLGRGLVRLILGFLADPSLKMEAEKRHEMVSPLLNVTVMETSEPISVSYTLSLSTGEKLNVKASQMIRWDKERSKFFTQMMDRSSGQKNLLECATYFSEVISKGVLWEKEDHVGQLSELIKLAFLLDFNKEAVDFLMKSKNLQVYEEDEKFLSEAFPSR